MDIRPHRRNKAVFSNFAGVVSSGPRVCYCNVYV